MKDITALVIALIVVALIVITVYFKVSVWNECRKSNSFIYCIQLIGK